MLDNAQFRVTVRESDFKNIPAVIELFQTLDNPDMHFYIKQATEKAITLDTCHEQATMLEHYPLEVLLPMVVYKVNRLETIPDACRGRDGISIRAFEIFQDHHGLHIVRTYLYAGK